jgi:error-prone DNA polymerase
MTRRRRSAHRPRRRDILSDYNATGAAAGKASAGVGASSAAGQTAHAGFNPAYLSWREARAGLWPRTIRQRPGTAEDVVFVTLEGEAGNVNAIIWPSLLEKQRREALGASLLAGKGM